MAGQAGNRGRGRQETVSPQPSAQQREPDAHRRSLGASVRRRVLACSCPGGSRHHGWLLRDRTAAALVCSKKRSRVEKLRTEEDLNGNSFM